MNSGCDCFSSPRKTRVQPVPQLIRSKFESKVAKLRAQLEKGEALRQNLEYELAVARKEANIIQCRSQDRIDEVNKIHEELKEQNTALKQRGEDLENALYISKQAREDDQIRSQIELEDREKIIHNYNAENELLVVERDQIDAVLQVPNNVSCFFAIMMCIPFLIFFHAYFALQRVKILEENIEAERAAHLESKFNSEIIQLRIRDLESTLQVEKSSHADAVANLEMIKQQFRDVELAYEREKSKTQESADQLEKFQKEYAAIKMQMAAEKEENKKMIADLSKKLQIHEENFANLREELTKAKKCQAFLEETYGGSMRELELLLDNFAVSGQWTSGNCKDKEKPLSPSVVLENLRHTLTDYQSRLGDASNEVTLALFGASDTALDLAAANKELNNWRSECADRDGLIGSMKMDLHNVKHCFEKEKSRAVEAENEIQKLTQAHQKNTEEKLIFLHSLYQRLVAGCVFLKQSDGMLAKFSWTELCSILQDNIETLTSDLNRASEKVSHLEHICRNKDETIKELQQSQDNTFSKLAEQMKEREAGWQKQKIELEEHYSGLLGEVHTRAQKCHAAAEEAKEKVFGLEKVKEQLTLGLSLLKKTLCQTQKEHTALLAACALMAGALYPLYSRSCAFFVQKNFLQEQIISYEYFKNEVKTVVQVLSVEGNPGKSKKRKTLDRGMIQVFRNCVIAVIAANRFRTFGRGCGQLFTWIENFKESPRLLVCTGRAKSYIKKQQSPFSQTLGWFSSSDLLAAVVDSVTELQDVIIKTDTNPLPTSRFIANAAKNSFSKLMDRISVEMENDPVVYDRYFGYGQKGSLIQILGHGLCRANAKAVKQGIGVTVPIKQSVEVLKKQILEFTQRLHAAEVERRSLRMELTQTKNELSEQKKETGKSQNLEHQLNDLKQKMVPFERFGSICEELNNALHREQQAQMLLNEQAHQMQELGLQLELHSSEEAEKDQTLSEAIKSLSEAKMELRRKDQSLRQLNKHLTQLEKDKRQLERSIQDAENALCMAAKNREHLISYVRSVDTILVEVRDQISLSWSVAARNDFTLQLPKLHMETFSTEGLKGGMETAAFQNLTQTFMDIYQLASSRIAALETEITSHQKHIAALKSELQTACLRENNGHLSIVSSRCRMSSAFCNQVCFCVYV
uniref:Coiled-coil domain containing 171 n=1 Tax=Callorhinchus milii TaxID=7868 RepID=A0A4W3I5V2_CALMI